MATKIFIDLSAIDIEQSKAFSADRATILILNLLTTKQPLW